jgi:hypothetical protein
MEAVKLLLDLEADIDRPNRYDCQKGRHADLLDYSVHCTGVADLVD